MGRNHMKKFEPEPPLGMRFRYGPYSDEDNNLQPLYRTAGEGAISPSEIIEQLENLTTLMQTPPSDYDEGEGMCSEVTDATNELRDRIDLLGIVDDEYECDISRMRDLIENASRYMTIGNFRQNVPNNVIKHFKDTMKNMNSIIGRNKHERNNGTD